MKKQEHKHEKHDKKEESKIEKSFYSLTHPEVNDLLLAVLQNNNQCLQTVQKQMNFNEHHIVNETIRSNAELIKKMENE
jgi:predicted component of type VI protein secretion system